MRAPPVLVLGVPATACLLLCSLFLVGSRCPAFRANRAVAQSDLYSIATAVESFALDHGGTCPTDLWALLAPDSAGNVYLDCAEIPRDPWKNPYLYFREPGGRGFRVSSLGADGAAGGSGESADLTVGRSGAR